MKSVNEKLNQPIIERDLYQLWINFCNTNIYSDKNKLLGIHSGTLNEIEGPDFQGAEFELNGKIYRGDVEIHKKCIDWQRHNHHLDPRYDRVVLHLVQDNHTEPVFNSKNQKITSISFSEFQLKPEKNNCIDKCILNSKKDFIPDTLIMELAFTRLKLKANKIYNLISDSGLDQSLYILILKSLGNTVNTQNFQILGHLIPWHMVYLFIKRNYPIEFWIALYLGTAGLTSFADDPILNKYWNKCLPIIEGVPMKKESWKLGGVRPKNHPQVRLTGLALFLSQLEGGSIFNTIKTILYRRLVIKDVIEQLMLVFNPVNVSNISKINISTKIFFGRTMMIELLGNVIIPLFLKISQRNNSKGFEFYLKDLYLNLPVSHNYGAIKKFGKSTQSKNANFFYLNQAWLHVQKNFCDFNQYSACPLKSLA